MGEEAGALGGGLACGLPRRIEKVEGRVPGEGEQVQRGQRHRQKCFAVAEIVFEFIAVIFITLKASFSIFQRALPHAAISATLVLLTGRLVTQAKEYLTRPLRSKISNPIQLTSAASLPSRTGTPSIQR